MTIMAAMWMLSASTSESGASDMMAALLLRGLGLGLVFLSITLIVFGTCRSGTSPPASTCSTRAGSLAG